MIEAITFDVFGTLLGYPQGCPWIKRYVEEVKAVNRDEKPYRPLSVIFEEIGAAWTELRPREGVIESLRKLGGRYTIAPLSNADTFLSAKLAIHFDLPWTLIIDTETAGVFKPNPKVYALALERLALENGQVLHVAAHKFDLLAARASGLKTAYIQWPDYSEAASPGEFDFQADSLADLEKAL